MYSSRKYFEKFPIVCKVLQRFLTFDLNHPDSQKKTRLTTRQYQNKGDSSTKVCSTNRPGWINGSVAATSSVLIMHSPRSVFVKVHQITLAGIDEPVKQIDVPQSPACVKILRPGAVAHTHTHTRFPWWNCRVFLSYFVVGRVCGHVLTVPAVVVPTDLF